MIEQEIFLFDDQIDLFDEEIFLLGDQIFLFDKEIDLFGDQIFLFDEEIFLLLDQIFLFVRQKGAIFFQNKSGRCSKCRIAATVRGEIGLKNQVSASTVASGMA